MGELKVYGRSLGTGATQAAAGNHTHPVYDRTQGQAGIMAPGGAAASVYVPGNLTLSANRAYLGRFVPSRDMTITLVAFNCQTASSTDDACDVGIYSAAFARLASAGATLGKLNPAAGNRTVSLAASLLAGVVYYAAFSVGAIGGTVPILRGTNTNSNMTDLFGTAAGVREQLIMDAAHPLPTTFVPAGPASSVPIMAIRES